MRVVALGGGHGLSATLRALRSFAGEVTAVASVADDGGSSGRLRADLGIPAPGDLRNCLIALSDQPSLFARAFNHRFAVGDLSGHPVGNVILAGLFETADNLTEAIDEAARLLGVSGRVLPATDGPVTLHGESESGWVRGEAAVAEAGAVQRVRLDPADATSPEQVVSEIAWADHVVLGPGSLYTSVLAASIPVQVRDALNATHAQRIYVSNLKEQRPETAGYSVADHVDAVLKHGVPIDVVLADPERLALGRLDSLGVPVLLRPLADPVGLHDPALLAAALREAFTLARKGLR